MFFGLVWSYIVAYAGGRSYGVQLANSVCETNVEQKITRLELHDKLGYKAYEVWEIKNIVRSPAPDNREHNWLEHVGNAQLCAGCRNTTRPQY